MDISKFSFSEMFSNDNGKTSGTAFVGVIICLSGTLCFLLGVVDKMFLSKTIDIISQSITFVLIGASLMGVRKIVGGKSGPIDDSVSNPDGPTTTGNNEEVIGATSSN